MVLNTPLSHKLSIYYYNTDVCKDPSNYRSSHPEVFCKKGVLRNFEKCTGKHLCHSLFFDVPPVPETPALVLSCELCEISKNAFFS